MNLPANFPPLCEILDAADRPICLMDYEEAKSQGLRHRAYATLLWHPPFYILRRKAEGFGFFCHSFLKPDQTAEEAAECAIAGCFGGIDVTCSSLGWLPPAPETGNALTAFCLARIPRRLALELFGEARAWLSATREELLALKDEGLYEPLFSHLISADRLV